MKNLLSNTLSTVDIILTLIGLTNTVVGVFSLASFNIIIGVVLLASGLIIMVYLFINHLRKSEVSIFITNNEKRFTNEIHSVIKSLDVKKEWMFVELAKKFPQMTVKTIKSLIDKHYKLITND